MHDRDFGPSLVRDFAALSDGDRSVLIAAAGEPGSTMMTSSGSPNDRLWTKLAKVGWTERADDVPEQLRSMGFAGWKITELGSLSLPVLFREAAKLGRPN